jgi:hypothetical protein
MESNFRTFLSRRKLQRDSCIKSTYHGRVPTAACCSNCVISDVMKASLAPAGYSRPAGCSCWRKSVLRLSPSALRGSWSSCKLRVSKMWSEGRRATELKVSQFIVSFHYAICSIQNVLCVRYQVLWRWQLSGIQRRAVSKCTTDLEVRTASMMEAVRISETSVYFNQDTRRYIPDRCHLQRVSCSWRNWSCGVCSSVSRMQSYSVLKRVVHIVTSVL